MELREAAEKLYGLAMSYEIEERIAALCVGSGGRGIGSPANAPPHLGEEGVEAAGIWLDTSSAGRAFVAGQIARDTFSIDLDMDDAEEPMPEPCLVVECAEPEGPEMPIIIEGPDGARTDERLVSFKGEDPTYNYFVRMPDRMNAYKLVELVEALVARHGCPEVPDAD